MRILVATFSYNRPNLLRLTTCWLMRDRTTEFDFVFFDDGSDHSVLYYLGYRERKGDKVFYGAREENRDKLTKTARANRVAIARHWAVEYFLSEGKYDFLMLRDDDVLFSCTTVLEAVQDLQGLLRCNFGALTLHGLCTHSTSYKANQYIFRELRLTGEAHVIFSRESLVAVGSHFDWSKEGGFGDTQFAALRDGGFKYGTRIEPTYAVQHLGIFSSIIHENEKPPFWNEKLYTNMYDANQPRLDVPGFDLDRFEAIAKREGGERAAGVFLTEGV